LERWRAVVQAATRLSYKLEHLQRTRYTHLFTRRELIGVRHYADRLPLLRGRLTLLWVGYLRQGGRGLARGFRVGRAELYNGLAPLYKTEERLLEPAPYATEGWRQIPGGVRRREQKRLRAWWVKGCRWERVGLVEGRAVGRV
jgi:hypothetical protein